MTPPPPPPPRLWWTSSSWMFRVGCAFLLVVFFCLEFFDLNLAQLKLSHVDQQFLRTTNCTSSSYNNDQDRNNSSTSSSSSLQQLMEGSTSMALSPGELPGYTGWARPEWTLAGYFSIEQQQLPTIFVVGETFSITVHCKGHEDCTKASSLFFLRAYGPAVVPGRVVLVEPIFETTNNNNMNKHDKKEKRTIIGSRYEFEFLPMDPGSYTVEAVLTFSNPPPLDRFPLPSEYPQPPYEGYLLPGFPLQVIVDVETTSKQQQQQQQQQQQRYYCSLNELTETSSFSALTKARWQVTSKANGPKYTSNSLTQPISEEGYKRNIHSIGIQMTYNYYSPSCDILPKAAFAKRQGNNNPFYQCGKISPSKTTGDGGGGGDTSSSSSSSSSSTNEKKLIVIFIGDSTMRIQHSMFDGYVSHLPNIETTWIDLYHGYRWVQKVAKTNIQGQLDDIQQRYANDRKVILFNTGLHDIHRLCGQEWAEDRRDYIKNDALTTGTFRCVPEYRSLIEEFATLIQQFPAQLKVFQTTTAGWPKYGNWGIDWNHGAQSMPLSPDVISQFNDIALDVFRLGGGGDGGRKFVKDIKIMDGYWITYARPDNREMGNIGKKLSHPGLEVQSAMTRIWATMILHHVCNLH